MKRFIVTILSIISAFPVWADPIKYVKPKNANEILHQLQQLQSFGTVMYLAAHPDDENTRLISYLVHEKNVRTIYLSLTRGDGGQNIIGNEQGKYLGLIRTMEMNEARKLDGAEQIYSSAIDFGFSKNPEEVLQKWNKPQLIKEIKQAFQTYQPDVVILRFPTTGEGGHGQHTASALLALEAYNELQKEAKTNPSLFVPTRILFNAFNFGDRSTQKEDQLKININQYNPLLGKSYGQLAGESRSMHKSQGAGTPQSFGIYKEYFQHLGGKEAQKDLLDNIATTWTDIGYSEIDKNIATIIKKFNPLQPQNSIDDLIKLHSEIKSLKNSKQHRSILYKLHQLESVIFDCTQMSIEALANKATYYAKDTIKVDINMAARAHKVTLKNINYIGDNNPSININEQLKFDSLSTYRLYIVNNAWEYDADQPYWLHEEFWPNYDNSDSLYHFKEMKNRALMAPFINSTTIDVNINIHGIDFLVLAPIQYKRLDPLRGDVLNPIRRDQSVKIDLQQPLVIIDSFSTIPVKISTVGMANSPLNLFIKQKNNQRKITTFYPTTAQWDTLINIPLWRKDVTDNLVNIIVDSDDPQRSVDNISSTTKVLRYDHIPETQYSIPAIQKIVVKDWTTKVKKIGYIQGADDLVDDVLKSLSFNVVNLSKTDFQNNTYIKSFDAIVVGIRAYNVNEDIASIHPLLMEYVKNGGTVIVQYNTDKNLKLDQFGPYPFKISRDRITQEDAPTTILNPKHRLLQYPNTIQPNDWDNWVQERGIYYPSQWDGKYEKIIQHQEFKENPLQSGILYTSYGKGHYIYTSLAFFRQLPDGNPGAIKLFINLLSQGK